LFYRLSECIVSVCAGSSATHLTSFSLVLFSAMAALLMHWA